VFIKQPLQRFGGDGVFGQKLGYSVLDREADAGFGADQVSTIFSERRSIRLEGVT